MATRPVFIVNNNKPYFTEELIDFEFFTGFSLSQKQKSISSLHNQFLSNHSDLNILEVSRKSTNKIGNFFSAFNLKLNNNQYNMDIPVECIFQSSKVFENGGPYEDLLLKSPIEAKRDERLKSSGRLVSFHYNGLDFSLEPKTLFYDWIYINAIVQNESIAKELLKYDAFSDIEFNPKKSINCQARSAAIFVGLSRSNNLDFSLLNIENFKKNYDDFEQTSLF